MRVPRLTRRSKPARDALVQRAGHEAESGRRLAMYDRETGLYASWYLERRFEEETRRARRYEHPLSLIVIEVRCQDHASRVRTGLRDWLDRSMRATDLATHLGGGRYAALVTETGLEDASAIAARLAESFPEDVAIGLASFPEDGEDLKSIEDVAERRSHGKWRLAV